jgi:hypothetical protein
MKFVMTIFFLEADFCICEADILLSQTYRTVPYRIPSHSATSLYNLRQFKPIGDQFTSIVYVVPASNLRTGVVWPRVILCHFHILASKISRFCLVFARLFYLRYYSEVIYQHGNLSSSGK